MEINNKYKSLDRDIFNQSIELSKSIFPLHRSISGDGIDKAFEILKEKTECKVHEYKTNEQVLDWVIPKSWKCNNMYIIDTKSNKKIIEFDHPLRVASHSIPVDRKIIGKELKDNLVHSEKYPNNLMHRYYYYDDKWSISVKKSEYENILDDNYYRVLIDSVKYDGSLKTGELLLNGEEDRQVLFLSHICHPAQFNDGLVGAALNIYLYNYIKKYFKKTRYTYKFLFLPETIGSIAYCSNQSLLDNSHYAIFSEMIALNQKIHIQQSLNKEDHINTLLEVTLKDLSIEADFSPYLKVIRNDEKVFNSPGIDIPSASLTRAYAPGSKDAPFYGYHTDLDSIENSNLEKFEEVIKIYQYLLHITELDCYVKRNFAGLPMLSRHNLFTDPLVDRDLYNKTESLIWKLDGDNTISKISNELDINFCKLYEMLINWQKSGLVSFL
ncbi:DUF4910 domain-containing protein [Candidatus Pseudothioglobus singularis]|jgi:aminopeptidase-like protein|nr:DUF4910 domain-containing protein [Candidatus Pseudothioglobus singularis]MDB4822112.1 DUF4910 domain-containing protein [Candidatus Pseudothioglobus singularis]